MMRAEAVNQIRALGNQAQMARTAMIPSVVNESSVNSSAETSEIPDNVTAELEKLEQEGAPMVEVEGVSAILGDLGDDDDELLAEMGADFNILEYADPELDNITGGEKTNILDLDLENVEVDHKDEKKKLVKEEDTKTDVLPRSAVVADSTENTSAAATTVATSVENANAAVPPATTQTAPQNPPLLPQAHAQAAAAAAAAAAVQQQMHQHVQQAAAMGRPMLPGTRLMSPDGVIGVVTSTNSVTVSYPTNFPGHTQRISHLQGKINIC